VDLQEEVNQHEAKKIERRGNYLNIYDKIAVQDPLQYESLINPTSISASTSTSTT